MKKFMKKYLPKARGIVNGTPSFAADSYPDDRRQAKEHGVE
jgi:hypothetical protein